MEEEVDMGAAPLGRSRSPTPMASPSPLLPDEMLFEFLLRLPIKNLHQCNCVSKAWRSLISSSEFIQAYKARHPDVVLMAAFPEPSEVPGINHFYYSTLRIGEPEEFVPPFQVSCPDYRCDQITEVIHGLVCFCSRNGLFLFNIFTREVMPLPNSSCPRKYFFGFDVVNGVYKLLGVNLHSIEILALGRGSDCCWRMVSDDFENGGKITFLESQLRSRVRSFSVSGVMYWMVLRERSRGRVRCCLVSFDLNKEKFRRIKLPRGLTSMCLSSHCFVKFRERLALSVSTYTGGYRLTLHILEDDEGNSWTKHSIALPEDLNEGHLMRTIPVGNLPDGQMLLVNPLILQGLSTPVYSYEGHLMRTIPVGNLPDGQMFLVNPLILEGLSTPVYSYDHRTFKFERFFVVRFPRFPWRMIRESAAYISCVEENLTPFDDLFSGVKLT